MGSKNEHGVSVEKDTVVGDPAEMIDEANENEGGFDDLEQFFMDDDDTVTDEDESDETDEESEEEVDSETDSETDGEGEEESEEAITGKDEHGNDVHFDEKSGEWTDTKTGEKLLPQSKVNQIMGNARIQGRELNEKVQMLQQMTGGMNLDQIIDHLRSQQVDQYESEYGVPREEAERFIEDRQVRGYLEEQLQNLHQQQQMTAAMASYNNEKAQYLKNPLVKKYEADIDAVSQGGQRLGFEAAMKYVLGEKAVSGEISQNIKDSTQQRVIKNASRKPTRTPEGAGAGGAPTSSIPPDLKRMAAVFGNDPKSVAREFQKLQRTPKR